MKPTLERINELNQGTMEAKNLMETLSIDFPTLLKNTYPDLNIPSFPAKMKIVGKMKLAASVFYNTYGFSSFDQLKGHPSDTMRGIACFVLAQHHFDPNTFRVEGLQDQLSPENWQLEKKLEKIRPLADDSHSGVREWAWMALRPVVVSNPNHALYLLQSWGKHTSERIRRFACEITRPRGVWATHIKPLKQEPWAAIHLLEALKADPAKYVQLSVGNWLNDAGKDHPDWVIDICSQWKRTSPIPETHKICNRALRRLIP